MTMMRKLVLGILVAQFSTGCALETGENEEIREVSQEFNYSYPNESDMNISGTDHSVVTRIAGELELLTIEGGSVKFRRFSNGWLAPVDLGRPLVSGTHRNLKSVAAVRNGNRIDVFAVADNNKIYHRFTGNSVSNRTFASGPEGGWYKITNHPTVRSGSYVTATSWGAGRIDLFWTTPNKNFGHAWAHNYLWDGIEHGDGTSGSSPGSHNSALDSLVAGSGNLEAVSWGFGRIDLFAMAGDYLNHVWYENGWGRESFHLQATDRFFPALDDSSGLAVTSKAVGTLEIFTGSNEGVRHSWFTGNSWHTTWNGNGRQLEFDLIEGTSDSWTLHSGVILNGGRTDLFGVVWGQGSHTIWDL